MSESYSLPTQPEGMVATLIERFNSGKVSAMMGNMPRRPCSSRKTGEPSLITQRSPPNSSAISDSAWLEAKARHVFVAGDTAQIVLDWSIDGAGPDGKHVHLGGSASDVLRRRADGLWRYIDRQ